MPEIKDRIWLESLCRAYTEANIRTLAGWANGKDTNDDLKYKAIMALMERGWGRPKQDQTHEVKGEIKVVLRQMLEDDDNA